MAMKNPAVGAETCNDQVPRQVRRQVDEAQAARGACTMIPPILHGADGDCPADQAHQPGRYSVGEGPRALALLGRVKLFRRLPIDQMLSAVLPQSGHDPARVRRAHSLLSDAAWSVGLLSWCSCGPVDADRSRARRPPRRSWSPSRAKAPSWPCAPRVHSVTRHVQSPTTMSRPPSVGSQPEGASGHAKRRGFRQT